MITEIGDPEYVCEMPLDAMFELRDSCRRIKCLRDYETMNQLLLAVGSAFSKEVGKQATKYLEDKVNAADVEPKAKSVTDWERAEKKQAKAQEVVRRRRDGR